MKLEHHLDHATILRYAAGDLDPAFTVVAAAHIAVCDQCREEVRLAEEIGGSILDGSDAEAADVELSDDAFESLMASLDADDSPDPVKDTDWRSVRVGGDVPYPLQSLIGPSLDEIQWKTVAPGVRKANLDPGGYSEGMLYLLRMSPGMAVPEHGHGGAEMTLVLRGAYADHFGVFSAGCVADHDGEIEHSPVVHGDEDCVCLVASEAPAKFKGLFHRMIQPLIGV